MKNVALYGFHEPRLASVVRRMAELGICRTPLWFGTGPDGTWTEDIADWHLGLIDWSSLGDGTKRLLPSRSEQFNQGESAINQRDFDIFVEQMSRNPCMIDQPYAQYRELWNCLLAKFQRELASHDVGLVVLQNLPHEGVEWALYCAAKRLHVTTLLLYQTVLPNRFCCCTDIDDFGLFETAAEDESAPPIRFENRFEKDLFYMRSTLAAPNRVSRGRLHHITNAVAIRFNDYRFRCKSLARRLKTASGWDRLRGKANRPVNYERDYIDSVRRATRPVDWRRRFVYFPLHLQPELTTSTIGDQYRDQLLSRRAFERKAGSRRLDLCQREPETDLALARPRIL